MMLCTRRMVASAVDSQPASDAMSIIACTAHGTLSVGVREHVFYRLSALTHWRHESGAWRPAEAQHKKVPAGLTNPKP